MSRCYACCQENCRYQVSCSCSCHEKDEPIQVTVDPAFKDPLTWTPDDIADVIKRLASGDLELRPALKIQTQTIKAQSRQLKAKWSAELADDIKAYHGLDENFEEWVKKEYKRTK